MLLVTYKLVLLLSTIAAIAACAGRPSAYNGAGAPRAETIVPLKSDRLVVGLALGGGGARGFAHIGVIKALEAAGIVPDIVTGSSSGAVIAALYAAGHDGRSLETIALELNRDELVDFVLFGSGWVRGEALQDFVNRMVKDRPIEGLARPFAVVATAAKSGKMVVFNRGNTGVAVRASASVPKLFIPPVIEGEEFVDGALTSPVPVRVARAMGADVVIAVDISWFAQARNAGSDGMSRYARSGRYQLLNGELESADVVIRPQAAYTHMLDFDQKAVSIAAGDEAAREALGRIAAVVARATAGRASSVPEASPEAVK
jgi:NTE family protein